MDGEEVGEDRRPFHCDPDAPTHTAARAIRAEHVARPDLAELTILFHLRGHAIRILREIGQPAAEVHRIGSGNFLQSGMQERLDDILRDIGRMNRTDPREARGEALLPAEIKATVAQALEAFAPHDAALKIVIGRFREDPLGCADTPIDFHRMRLEHVGRRLGVETGTPFDDFVAQTQLSGDDRCEETGRACAHNQDIGLSGHTGVAWKSLGLRGCSAVGGPLCT